MAPIGVGIIGLSADQSAWATSAHSAPLKSSPLNEKFKLVAVSTSSPETAKKAAEAQGISADKAYSNPQAIADDKDVDLVVVSVKTPYHKQLALPALHAKKSVFVEWPLGNGLQEAEELAALAKKQGVKTAVGLQARLLPSVQKAKSIIDSGTLGRIIGTTLISSSSLLVNFPVKNSYLNDPKSGANLVTIPTIHALDPVLYLLGEFKSFNATTATTFPELRFVQADGSKGEPVKSTIADSISIHGVLESGATISFVSSSTTEATPGHFEWIISGEKGSLKFESPGQFIAMAPHTLSRFAPAGEKGSGEEDENLYAKLSGGGGKWEEVEFEKGPFGGIGEVYEAFAEGNKDMVDFDEAVKRHKLVEAIFRSAKDGTREEY
ncbi:MAG: transcription regulator gal80 [Alectoria sarmentosa]|nr:MAG: transcription regulator gal80 [Alectoria sarmentosa]